MLPRILVPAFEDIPDWEAGVGGQVSLSDDSKPRAWRANGIYTQPLLCYGVANFLRPVNPQR